MSEESVSYLRDRIRDLERKNEDLEKDNKSQRDEIRDYKASNEQLDAQVKQLTDAAPKEGSVILSSDAEKAKWKKFSELGDGDDKGDPDKLAALLQQGAKDARAVLRSKNASELAKVQIKPSILRLSEFDNVNISFQEEGEGDDKGYRGTVKVNGEEKSWSDWVKEYDLTDAIKDFMAEESTSSVAAPSAPKLIGQPGKVPRPDNSKGSASKYIAEVKESRKEAAK